MKLSLLKLLPRLTRPTSFTVFGLVLLVYCLVISGVMYDLIHKPPSMGTMPDPKTGQMRPAAFLPNRLNGQYIIEGLTAGALFCAGGFGMILLDWAVDQSTSKKMRLIYVIGGLLTGVVCYMISMLFIRIKVPGYLVSTK